ncbi:MAG: bifunctional folylpolyglutamate synthase/dihydrofolate synthase [Thermoplasmata archaeon]
MPRATRTEPPAPAKGTPGYAEALDGLFRRRRFGMRPGLESIRALLEELGDPERTFEAVHVAGSKGKGSVSTLVASILGAAGAGPVGLYTSPHLVSYRERIRVDGAPIEASEVVEGLARVRSAALRAHRREGALAEPTFFEATTALAFDHFARHRVRAAAVEVGLGGEFDATNVLPRPVGIVTTIELEHTDVLGPTLTDVARAKAGILHVGMRAATGEVKPEPLGEIERVADRHGVPIWRLGREVELLRREVTEKGQELDVRTPHRTHLRLKLPAHGTFQARNAALAVAAVDLYEVLTGQSVPEAAVHRGFRRFAIRGRLERVARRPDLFVDIAHTPESAFALAESLGEIAPFADPEGNVLLFGCLAGKRITEILDRLAPLARTLVAVPVRSDRAIPVAEIRRAGQGRFPRIVEAPSATAGLAVARAATDPEGYTLATGSDYLVGEILARLEGSSPGEPDLSDPPLAGSAPDPRDTAARSPG